VLLWSFITKFSILEKRKTDYINCRDAPVGRLIGPTYL
jgi:hypothetical protein